MTKLLLASLALCAFFLSSFTQNEEKTYLTFVEANKPVRIIHSAREGDDLVSSIKGSYVLRERVATEASFPLAYAYKPLPGRIEAESFDAMKGVSTATTTDVGGGLHITSLDGNDWLDYNINVAEAGTYTFSLRVAGPAGQLRLRKGRNGPIIKTIDIPATANLQTWITVSTSVVLSAGNQTLNLDMVKGVGNLNWFEATVPEKPQAVITFGALAEKTVGDAPFELVTTSTNGEVPITFSSSNPAVVSVSNSTGKWLATVVGAGTANITASQAASTSYRAAVDVVQAQVVKAAPEKPQSVITFGALPEKTVGDAPFELVATSTNPEVAITFSSSNASVVSVSNSTGKWLATVVAAGTANITASQAASTSYRAAVDVVQAQVVKAAPEKPQSVITFGALPEKTVGDAPFELVATSTNPEVAITFSSSNASVVSVSNSTGKWLATVVAAGTANITASQAASTSYRAAVDVVQAQVVKAAPEKPQSVITFGALPEKTVGDAPFELVATSTNSEVAITFSSSNASVVSVSNSTGKWLATIVSAGTASITASQAASTSYRAAVDVVQAQVVKAAPEKPQSVITFGALAEKTVGDAPFELVATSTNPEVAITFSSSNPAVVSVSNSTGKWLATVVAAGTANITASQAASTSYRAAVDVVQAQVVKAAPEKPQAVITFGALPEKTVGDAPFELVATSTNSEVAITFSSSNASVVSVSNSTGKWLATIVSAGTASITASQAASTSYRAAVDVVQAQVVKAAPVSGSKILPGRIEAESYDAMKGVVIASTTDAGGGSHVTNIDGNDWMDYNVSVTSAGTYTFTLRVAGPGGQMRLRKGRNGSILKTIDIPATANLQTWTTVSTSVALTAGNQTLSIDIEKGSWNFNWFEAAVPEKPQAVITFGALPEKTVGDAPFELVATSTNPEVAITFSSSNPAVVSVSNSTGKWLATVVGAGTANITASQAASTSYRAAVDVVQAQVVKPAPEKPQAVITFGALPEKTVGDAPFELVATSTNPEVAITFSSSNPAVVSVSNSTGKWLATVVGAGTANITASQAASTSYRAAVDVVQAQVVKPAPEKPQSVITFGALPEKTVGDAPFELVATSTNPEVAITFSSSNPAVVSVSNSTGKWLATIVSAGTANITASQAASTSYRAAVDVVQAQVVKPAPEKPQAVITFGALPEKTVGDAPFELVATSTNPEVAITFSSSNPAVVSVSNSTGKWLATVVGAGTANITASQVASTSYRAAVDVVQAQVVKPAPEKPQSVITFGALPE
ncbi:carbohydrate-binding protein, partial [Nibrella saemangeumensis]|uniref:carbohydrate-binding protein n=1 Tax=Nibrella saemangeumensis TaxID=1084526 RepID=UPI0031E66BFA